MSDWLAAVVLIAIGLALVTFGVAAYRGRGKFAVTTWMFPTAHFATAWIGSAVLSGGVGRLVVAAQPDDGPAPVALRVLGGVVLLVGAVCWLVGLVGLFWLPAVLTPGWFRQWRARGSDPQEFASPEHLTWLDRLVGRTVRQARAREARRRDR